MLHCSKVQGVRRPGDKRGWSYTSRHETASAVIVNLLIILSCAFGFASTISETGGNTSIYASFLRDGNIGLRYMHANLFSPRFPEIANSNSISVLLIHGQLYITLCVICVFLRPCKMNLCLFYLLAYRNLRPQGQMFSTHLSLKNSGVSIRNSFTVYSHFWSLAARANS